MACKADYGVGDVDGGLKNTDREDEIQEAAASQTAFDLGMHKADGNQGGYQGHDASRGTNGQLMLSEKRDPDACENNASDEYEPETCGAQRSQDERPDYGQGKQVGEQMDKTTV